MPKEIQETPEKYLEELRNDAEKAIKEANDTLKTLVKDREKAIKEKNEKALVELAEDAKDVEKDLKYSLTKNAAKLLVLNCRDKTAEFDEDPLDYMARQSILSNALKQTSIGELMQAIRTGDTKDLEKTVMNHLVAEEKVPKPFLKHFSPNARSLAESLQKEMGGPEFKQLGQDDQVKAYAKLLGARAAVRADRNTFRGKSLDKPLNLASYRDTMKQMEAEQPVNDALCNLIKKEGADKVNSWARNGTAVFWRIR